MAGTYLRAKYETDVGGVHPCRIQPETLAGAYNPQPAGAIDSAGSVNMTPSRRRNGISARYITIAWNDPASVPQGYDPRGTLRLPILTPAKFNGILVGEVFSYLGSNAIVLGKNPEKIR